MRQIVFSNVFGTPSNSAVRYCPVYGPHQGSAAWNATEGNVQEYVKVAGTFSRLTVQARSAPTNAGTYTIALRVNGVTTALTVTIAAGVLRIQDLEHPVSVAADDLIDIICTPSGTPTSLYRPSISLVFTPTTSGVSQYLGGSFGAPSNAARNWNSLQNGNVWRNATNNSENTLFAVAGTITKFWAYVATAPGVGATREYSIYKNGVQEASSVGTITGTGQLFYVTGLSIAVAAGDYFHISHNTTAGTPTATVHMWGVEFTPTTDGECNLCGTETNVASASTVQYNRWSAASAVWTSAATAEFDRRNVFPVPATLSKFRANAVYAAPGVGNTVDFWLRRNSVDGNQTCQIAGTNQAATDGSNTDKMVDLDEIGMRILPSASAVQSNYSWAVKAVVDAVPSVTEGRIAQPIFNGTVGQVALNDSGFLPVMGSNGVSNSLAGSYDEISEVIPPGYSGVISDLRILLDGAPATGTFTATLYKNGSATALTVAITAGTTGADTNTAHAVSVTGGDTIGMHFATSGGAGSIAPKGYSVKLLGDNAGEFVVMGASSDASIAWGTRVYYRPNSPEIANTTLANAQDVVPLYCKLKAWRADISPASASDVNTLTLYKNGTAITATAIAIAASATTGNVTGLTQQLYPGDLLTVSAISDTFDTVDAHTLKVSFLFTADTHGESWFGAGSADDLITDGTTEYAQPQVGNVVWRTTERPALAAIACTLRDLRVYVTGTPGSAALGDRYTFTTRKNGSDTSQVTVLDNECWMNDEQTNTDSLSAGDYVILKVVSANTPTARDATWAWVVYTTPVAMPVAQSLFLRSMMGVGL